MNNEIPSSLNFTNIFHGMIGRDFITAFNTNFSIADEKIIYLLGEMIYRIKSSDIKEFRVKDGVVQYTTNGTQWSPVDITQWGNIKGKLTDQTDLKEALDLKAAADTVTALSNLVSTINQNLSILTGTVNEANENINNNSNAIAGINNTLLEKVTSTTIKEIRLTNGVFQWSPDGINWYQQEIVNTIPWGNLIGDLSQQSDLYQELTKLQDSINNLKLTSDGYSEAIATLTNSVNTLTNKVNTAELNINNLNNVVNTFNDTINRLSTDKADATALTDHINDHSNPHQVTKSQVGLGNVDNTADANKPVSGPQLEFLNQRIDEFSTSINASNLVYSKGNVFGIGVMTSAEYYSNIDSLSNSVIFVDDNIVSEILYDTASIEGTSGNANLTDAEMNVAVEVEEVTR